MRQCGDCTLCCKLLPMKRDSYSREQVAEAVVAMVQHGLATAESFRGMMPDLDKPAGERCPHQGLHGCKVYARRPFGCRYWNCRWLVNNDTGDLRRPDRSRYVIDIMPDFVTMDPGDGSPPVNAEVVQIWVDPKRPDVWREDPALLAYIERRAREGILTLIRFDHTNAITVFAPPLSSDGQWHEIGGQGRREHRGDELIEGLATCHRLTGGADHG